MFGDGLDTLPPCRFRFFVRWTHRQHTYGGHVGRTGLADGRSPILQLTAQLGDFRLERVDLSQELVTTLREAFDPLLRRGHLGLTLLDQVIPSSASINDHLLGLQPGPAGGLLGISSCLRADPMSIPLCFGEHHQRRPLRLLDDPFGFLLGRVEHRDAVIPGVLTETNRVRLRLTRDLFGIHRGTRPDPLGGLPRPSQQGSEFLGDPIELLVHVTVAQVVQTIPQTVVLGLERCDRRGHLSQEILDVALVIPAPSGLERLAGYVFRAQKTRHEATIPRGARGNALYESGRLARNERASSMVVTETICTPDTSAVNASS